MIVYLTTNKVNGKKYIGSTNKTYEQAIKANYLGSQKELKADIESLGADKFSFEVIEQCNDLNHCRERERYHHDLNNVAKSQQFYNKKHGHYGATGHRYSGEQSLNLSRALRGKKRKPTTVKAQSNRMKGKKPSELSKARGRLTKMKNALKNNNAIRKRGNSWCIRINAYGTELNYTYAPCNDYEAVRQSFRELVRPILKMYEEDVRRLESEQGEIKFVKAPKEFLTQQGFTKVGRFYHAQYCEQKFGKISVKYLGSFETKFKARMATLFYWNKLKRNDYKRSVLIEDNLDYFRTKKR